MVMTGTDGDDGNSESTDDGQFIPITVEEVSKLFSKCKVGKACGPDNLCTRISKECSVELAPVFCKHFNLIQSRLLSHIVLDEHQFAYKKNRSTKDACIKDDKY